MKFFSDKKKAISESEKFAKEIESDCYVYRTVYGEFKQKEEFVLVGRWNIISLQNIVHIAPLSRKHSFRKKENATREAAFRNDKNAEIRKRIQGRWTLYDII